jgi:hypothetical protein
MQRILERTNGLFSVAPWTSFAERLLFRPCSSSAYELFDNANIRNSWNVQYKKPR